MLFETQSVTRFKTLVQPNTEASENLLHDAGELFDSDNRDVLYGLPKDLLDAIEEHLPKLFSQKELSFERRLSEFLQTNCSTVGIAQGALIVSSLFQVRGPITISAEDFKALGWGRCGIKFESLASDFTDLEERSAAFHDQTLAYAGWLITNPAFLTGVSEIRQRTPNLISKFSNAETELLIDPAMDAFCGKWQLAGMATWDLPEPQGPNLAGIGLPESARRGNESVSIELPLSMRLPARLPIGRIAAEIRNQAAQPHLAEWLEILERSGKKGPGFGQFTDILKIQFYRNIVLMRRYGQRFVGNVEPLDLAFGSFLSLSQDSIKKLRLAIQKRIGG